MYKLCWQTFKNDSRLFCHIEGFHSRGQYLCKFMGTNKSVYKEKKSSNPTGLVWNANMAAVFIVLGQQYGRPDVI